MRIFARLLAALAALCLASAAYAAGNPARVVAIGDLHGDYAAYLDIVQAAGVADVKGRWTGGRTVLVQLGDVPDRGPDTRKIIEHLGKLQKAATKAGGEVVALVGNHEAMNVTGDLRYVTAEEYGAFKTKASKATRDKLFEAYKRELFLFYRRTNPEITEREVKEKWFAENPLGKIEQRRAWAPDGELGRWVIGHPAIVKIGDTLFVHGGISIETAARPIAAINAEVRAELAKGESEAESILTDELGPLWYRGNVMRDPPPPAPPPSDGSTPAPPPPARPSIADELTQVLAAYGAKRLVVAHTPNVSGILAAEGGRLLRVDTGISAYYGGVRSFLEIVDGVAVAHKEDAQGNWTSETLPQPGG
jgi:hypothetical protein